LRSRLVNLRPRFGETIPVGLFEAFFSARFGWLLYRASSARVAPTVDRETLDRYLFGVMTTCPQLTYDLTVGRIFTYPLCTQLQQ